MRKAFTLVLLALAIMIVAVSCDDPKHEHSYDANKWEKDGTSHWHVCTTCGEKVDVANHTLETTEAKEPTCTEKGWDEYVTCSVCDYSTYKEKAALGHDYTSDGKCTRCVADNFEIASIGDTKYTSLASAITASTGSDTIKLLQNITLTKSITISKGVTIDLDGKTVTLAVSDTTKENVGAFELIDAEAAYTVTVKNGKITGAVTGQNDKSNAFSLNKNAALTLDGVEMDVVCKRGIQVRDYSKNAKISVKDSTLKVKDGKDGVYVIATNAAVKNNDTSTGITVNITGSTLEATSVENDECGSTALLLNVPGDYKITNSNIKGERQAAIFRGGTYTVSGSTFVYAENNTHNSDCETNGWGNGNDVPNATIVIGNKTRSEYAYTTTVTFSGDNTLTYPADGRSLYIYQADKVDGDTDSVDRSVKVKGYNESWTVNDDFNGATVKSTDEKTWYVAGLSSLEAAVDAKNTECTTVSLLADVDLSDKVAGGTEAGIKIEKSLTVEGNGHKIFNNKPVDKGTSALLQIGHDNGALEAVITLKDITIENSGEVNYVKNNSDGSHSGSRLIDVWEIQNTATGSSKPTGAVNFENVKVTCTDDAGIGYYYRGISFYGNKNITVSLNSCNIYIPSYYAVYFFNDTGLKLNINGGSIHGWAVIDNYGEGDLIVTADGTTFNSENIYAAAGNGDNDFAAVKFEKLQTGATAKMTCKDCTFNVSAEKTAKQRLVSAENGSLVLKSCTINPKGENCELTYGGTVEFENCQVKKSDGTYATVNKKLSGTCKDWSSLYSE